MKLTVKTPQKVGFTTKEKNRIDVLVDENNNICEVQVIKENKTHTFRGDLKKIWTNVKPLLK